MKIARAHPTLAGAQQVFVAWVFLVPPQAWDLKRKLARYPYTRTKNGYAALQTCVQASQQRVEYQLLGSIGTNGTSGVNDFDDTHPLSQLVFYDTDVWSRLNL